MSSPMLSAKTLPCAMRTDEELEKWISSFHPNRRLGPVAKVPPEWHEHLSALPSGYVLLAASQMVRCKGNTVQPISFAEPLPAGQMVFLVEDAA